jgi:hypothetical protein
MIPWPIIKLNYCRLIRYLFVTTNMARWIIFICLVFCIGCSKVAEIDLENTKALVINSVFKPNEPFTFSISTTASLFTNYDSLNENLHFFLYEEDKLVVDSILHSGILETNLLPERDKKYSLEVKSVNFQTIEATDSIPNLVPIDTAYMIFPAGVDAYGVYYTEANITFTDPPNEINYYELLIHNGANIRKNLWYTEYETNDPVLLSEGDQDYHPTTFFFSDELFNGESYTIRIKGYAGYIAKNNKLTPYPLYATLRSVSKTYYKYRKYYTRHAYNQQFQNEFLDLVFKGEPQNMYTNVENGYGIFAGYCETTHELIWNE